MWSFEPARSRRLRVVVAPLVVLSLFLAAASAVGASPPADRRVVDLSGLVSLDDDRVYGPDVVVRLHPGTTVSATGLGDPRLVFLGPVEALGSFDAPVVLNVPVVIDAPSSAAVVLKHVVIDVGPGPGCALTVSTPGTTLRMLTIEGGGDGVCIREPLEHPSANASMSPLGRAGNVGPNASHGSRQARLVDDLLPPGPATAPSSPVQVVASSPHSGTLEVVISDAIISSGHVGIHIDTGAPPVTLSRTSIDAEHVGLRVDGGPVALDHVAFVGRAQWNIITQDVGAVDWHGTSVEVSCVKVVGRQDRGCERGSVATTPLLMLLAILPLLSEAGRRTGVRFAVWSRLYSRFDKTELLDHPVRAAVLDLVTERPGMHLRALADEIGGYGRTAYHLQRLEDAGFLWSQREGQKRCFYPESLAPPVGDPRPTREKILAVVTAESGIHAAAIARRLGISRQLATYHVNELNKERTVDIKPAGGTNRVYCRSDPVVDPTG